VNAAPSRAVIAGRILSGLAVAFLLFSSLLKFFAPATAVICSTG